MEKKYEAPVMEITKFVAEDVIIASDAGTGGGGVEEP